MMATGSVENCLMIFDMNNLNVFNAPYKMIKDHIVSLTSIYKNGSRSLFVLNTPKTFSVLWNVVSYVVNDMTRAKMSIVSQNTCKLL